MRPSRRRLLEAAFHEATVAVRGDVAVSKGFAATEADDAVAFASEPPGGVHVLALGKAAVPMARAAHARLGAAASTGLVITKDGHAEGFDAWPVIEAAHPVPDARSVEAGHRALAFAAAVPGTARLLVLLSGGTSALCSTPVAGLEPSDLSSTHALLLASGAPIEEVNAVRRRLSAVSGGRLAAASPARRIDVWVVSDVLGDDPAAIASGPCSPDPGGFAHACDILRARGLWAELPERVRTRLAHGEASGRRDVPSASDPVFERVHLRIVASNAFALRAAEGSLRRAGARVMRLSERLEGEARTRGRQIAALAATVESPQPIAWIAGGETTVSLGGRAGTARPVGLGGRSQEFALSAALRLGSSPPAAAVGADTPRVTLLAAGTDGTDGPTDAAGAVVDHETSARAERAGRDPVAALEGHDAHGCLDAAGALLRTGPTGTNVMDLVLVWIDLDRRAAG